MNDLNKEYDYILYFLLFMVIASKWFLLSYVIISLNSLIALVISLYGISYLLELFLLLYLPLTNILSNNPIFIRIKRKNIPNTNSNNYRSIQIY